MKKLLPLFSAALLLISCDDGDLIVTEFSFENQQLQHCGTGETQVLYNVNNDQVNESIAFIFSMSEEEFLNLQAPVEITLGQANQIIYRTFDAEVDDYYCSQIPPASPRVVTEFRSTSGGKVTITPQLRNQEDHDGDGVPSAIEMEAAAATTADGFPDTDGDGIPDYLDVDDDNDNVRTKDEINASGQNSIERYFDTDGDGIPDYLDNDDDGDGVITRYEDLNKNLNPADDRNDGLANYLNPAIVDSFVVDQYITNIISRSFRLEVSVDNLTLQNQGEGGEEITMINYLLGYFDTPSRQITLPEEGDEDEDGEGEETPEEGESTDEGDGNTES